MLKKLATIVAISIIGALPLATSALTLSELQAQIQSLMAQVSAMQGETNATSPVRPTETADDYGTGEVASGMYCPKLSSTFQRGARDATSAGQVSELQSFLTDYYNLGEGVLSGGYFGATTLKYIVKFQTDNGLPALGIVGSLTRVKIAKVCGNVTSSASFSASPTSGPAPLLVTFTAPTTGGSYSVDFGNGISAPFPYNTDSPGSFHNTMGYTYESPGTYTASLMKFVPSGTEYARVTVGTLTIKVTDAANAASGITVTAPNGGERWEVGTMNTITWTPYGYNPDVNPAADVTAYLEGTAYGSGDQQIVPSGKASIHWEGQVLNEYGKTIMAKPGSYYVKLINKKTGATDKSNAPFTILPKSVDLKLAESDGPIWLVPGGSVAARWTSNGASTCELHNAVLESNPSVYPASIPRTGSAGIIPSSGVGNVTIMCTKPDGVRVFDSVAINPLSIQASLQITSPNGGETIVAHDTTQVKIAWRMEGVSAPPLSIALYKDDKWVDWIAKDIGMDKSLDGTYSYLWTPNAKGPALPTLSAGVNPGYKIYITAPKADGTGYVDDKSDAPFSFVKPTTSTTTVGRLSLSVSSAPAAQTVVAGSTGLIVGNIALDAQGSSEDVRVSAGHFLYTDNMPLDPTNCQAFDGATVLTTGARIVNPSGTGTKVFTFDTPVGVAKGTVKMIAIKCSIPSNATTGSFSWGLQMPTFATATGITTGATITPQGVASVGNTMTVNPGGLGSLSVSTDASTPSYQIAAAGSTGVTLGAFKLRATGENIRLDRVILSLNAGTASASDLTMVTLWSGATQIGSATFVALNTTATSTLSVPVLLNRDTDTVITVKGNLSPIGIAQPGTPGNLVSVFMPYAQGVGVSSGLSIVSPANTSGPGSIAGVRIFKSYPTISDDPMSTPVANGEAVLMRFKVSANAAGDIGVKQFTFTTSQMGMTVSGIGLYAFTDAAYSTPVSGQANNGQVGSSVNPANNQSFAIAAASQAVQIPAGQTRYFELRGTVAGSSNTASVLIKLLGDSSYSGMNALPQNSFVWSPNDFGTTQFSDQDWTNGYRIPGLSSGGLTQVRTGTATVNGASSNTNTTASRSITTNASTYAPGSPVTVSWSGITSPTHDWVYIAPAGGEWPAGGTTPEVNWSYTNGVPAGSKKLTAPTAPGKYEAVYYLDNDYTELMRSTPFTVTAPMVTGSSVSVGTNSTQLASALAALEATLKALLAKLAQ